LKVHLVEEIQQGHRQINSVYITRCFLDQFFFLSAAWLLLRTLYVPKARAGERDFCRGFIVFSSLGEKSGISIKMEIKML
jgi:hypothetical protein